MKSFVFDKQAKNVYRIYARVEIFERSFEKLFEECYLSIWGYGKKDLYIQDAMEQMISQLNQLDTERRYSSLFTIFLNALKKEISKNEF